MARVVGARDLPPSQQRAVLIVGLVAAGALGFGASRAGLWYGLAVGLVFAAIIGAAVGGAASAQRTVMSFARENNFAFQLNGPAQAGGPGSAYPMDSGIGPARRSLVVAGEWRGKRAWSFDYLAPDDSTYVPSKFRLTGVYSGVALPTIYLVPRRALATTPDALGASIEFESADFTRHWRVVAGTAAYAHAMVTPRVMERLLQDDARGTLLVLDGTSLYTAHAAMGGGARRIAADLNLVAELSDLWPRHAVAEYSIRPADVASFGRNPAPQRRLNWIATLARVAAGSVVLAPLAPPLALFALRASLRGKASNPSAARQALGSSLVGVPLFAVVVWTFWLWSTDDPNDSGPDYADWQSPPRVEVPLFPSAGTGGRENLGD